MSARRATVLMLAAIGCGDPAPRVALVPINPCGPAAGANQLAITAFAASGEVKRAIGVDEVVDLGDLPADTVQLAVEIVIGGGAIGAQGKTLPLAFDELGDGATIPIVMAPPDGLCPVGALTEPRKAPLIARAGDGALIVGGVGPDGPLSTAERYDARTATFAPVELPDALRDDDAGLAGAVLATLPDGRVALSGGSRGLLAIYDPATATFGAAFALAPQRAFHGAVATAGGVLVAGGCQGVAGATCNASPLRSTIEYAPDGAPIQTGPSLATDAIAEGGVLLDTGAGFVLAGGFGTPGEAHRFALDDATATRVTGVGAQPVLLDGGAVLTAFGADGAPPDGAAAVITPDGAVAPIRTAPARAGVRLVALEDGGVLALGGGGDVARYDPMRDAWTVATAAGAPPPALDAPSLVRLLDGSVLVVGGDPAPSTAAYVYRPSLIGPATGSLTAVPASPTSPGRLVAPDPRTVTRGATWELAAADGTLAARALVAGPRFARGSIKVTATIAAGGLALIAQQTAPGDALVAHLAPGAPARLEQLGLGTVCTGDPVPAAAGATTASLTVGEAVEVRVGDAVVLACDHRATATGAWGLAASGAGARIDVATVTIAR